MIGADPLTVERPRYRLLEASEAPCGRCGARAGEPCRAKRRGGKPPKIHGWRFNIDVRRRATVAAIFEKRTGRKLTIGTRLSRKWGALVQEIETQIDQPST